MKRIVLALAVLAFAFGGAHAFTLTVAQGSDLSTLLPNHRSRRQKRASEVFAYWDRAAIAWTVA